MPVNLSHRSLMRLTSWLTVLQAQINYSMVKAIATALDQKVQILENAKNNFTPSDDITFAEAAMMSQIQLWDSSL